MGFCRSRTIDGDFGSMSRRRALRAVASGSGMLGLGGRLAGVHGNGVKAILA